MKPNANPIPICSPTNTSNGIAKRSSRDPFPDPPTAPRTRRSKLDCTTAGVAELERAPTSSTLDLSFGPALAPDGSSTSASRSDFTGVIGAARIPDCSSPYASEIGSMRQNGSPHNWRPPYALNKVAIPQDCEIAPKRGAVAHQVSAPHARARGAASALPAQDKERITKASSSAPVSVRLPIPRKHACHAAECGRSVSAATANPLSRVAAIKTFLRLPVQSASAPRQTGAQSRTAAPKPPSSPRSWVVNPFDSSQRNV
eukprot:scaffold15686_cov30-Tisochrysis_lutea.AAC.2